MDKKKRLELTSLGMKPYVEKKRKTKIRKIRKSLKEDPERIEILTDIEKKIVKLLMVKPYKTYDEIAKAIGWDNRAAVKVYEKKILRKLEPRILLW
jgi:hypothetical protein